MSYGWSAQDDLVTLLHDFAETTNDNTFTDTFMPSHQLATSLISNASFRWRPGAAGTDTYGASTVGGNANSLNQYPTVTPAGGPAATLSYDMNGNLASDGTWTYEYDPENRLMQACTPSCSTGSTTAFYTYDPLGRRTSKAVGSTTTYYLDDRDTEIAEYDGSGDLLRRYVPGPNIDEPIAMVTPPASPNPEVVKYFHYDKIGSVVAMSDASGTVEMNDGPYTYDAYGNMTGPITGVPFRFTGQRLDPETGLYYYRARYYSSSLGRFLQVDPVGYKDDLGLYTYVGNDPTDMTDPMGRDPCDICSIVFLTFVVGTWEATHKNTGGTTHQSDEPPKPETAPPPKSNAPAKPPVPGSGTVPAHVGPGPNAHNPIPAGPSATPTGPQQDAIDQEGDTHGCHTCGTTDPGTKSGSWVGDHQPPTALNPPGGSQVYYPQCLQCSNQQGGLVRGIQRGLSGGTNDNTPDAEPPPEPPQ